MSSKKWFKNDSPIKLSTSSYSEEIKKLDLNTFPLIDDFSIVTRDRGQLGYHVYFLSNKFGLLASFPWWDHAERDLKDMDISKIPIGRMDNPFDDLEQSWQILIWEKRDNVYIMEGEDPCCTEFPVWFRIKKEKYLGEWERVLREFQQII